MGRPDWSKIPFEKLPLWKQEEIIAHEKKQLAKYEEMQKEVERKNATKKLKCDTCDFEAKNAAGLVAHARSHK